MRRRVSHGHAREAKSVKSCLSQRVFPWGPRQGKRGGEDATAPTRGGRGAEWSYSVQVKGNPCEEGMAQEIKVRQEARDKSRV